ncbi:MAG: hypothetical protein P3X22_002895 [Thermoprotei archaeon]|nr:hypothetical protein [Thermoprotei archaeon]
MGHSVQVPNGAGGDKRVTVESQVISIPHNIVVAGHKQLGLDAYFWDELRVTYRRILLVRNAETLSVDPLGCKLPAEISPMKQIEDLKKLAAGGVGEERSVGPPLSLIRISSLLIPYTIAEKAQDPMVRRLLGTDEQTMAVKIAATLLSWGELRSESRIMWLNVKLSNHNVEDRLLEVLRHIDEGFGKALAKALVVCRKP